MNICFIGSLRYPGIYGDTRRMIPLFKHLQKKGHKIILIIVDEKSDDKCEIYEGFEIHRVGIKSLQKLGKISKLLAKIIIPFKVFKKAKKIVVAVPVSGKDVAEEIAKNVDEIIVLEKPEFFQAVAQVYRNWHDCSDQEVTEIMERWQMEKYGAVRKRSTQRRN